MRDCVDTVDLVLQGGGVKGIGLVGAVSTLYEKGYRLGERGRVAGTSAGAIVGALVATGMAAPEMARVMREVDYGLFQDSPRLGKLGRGVSLLSRLGLYRGDYLHQWLTDQLAARGVRKFKDLVLPPDPENPMPQCRQYRLVVVVSDVTSGRMIRLPWDYAHYGLDPDEQPVADAVRASASIPFFYRPFKLKVPGTERVAVLTDGGMLSNYPITIFDRGNGKPRWPTIGVKLSARDSDKWTDDWATVRSPLSLGKALVATMINAHDRLDLDEPAACARTVFVKTDGIRATDFKLDPGRRLVLFESGRAAAQEFLQHWDFDAYLRQYRL
jgi:NTE family protein